MPPSQSIFLHEGRGRAFSDTRAAGAQCQLQTQSQRLRALRDHLTAALTGTPAERASPSRKVRQLAAHKGAGPSSLCRPSPICRRAVHRRQTECPSKIATSCAFVRRWRSCGHVRRTLSCTCGLQDSTTQYPLWSLSSWAPGRVWGIARCSSHRQLSGSSLYSVQVSKKCEVHAQADRPTHWLCGGIVHACDPPCLYCMRSVERWSDGR